ncbi:MAG: hypothetical protein AAB432_00635 [Patescibacteria group bacterium]
MGRVLVVTTTMYQNIEEVRFKLACEFVRQAIEKGYQVLIIDNSPENIISDVLQAIGATVVDGKGRSFQEQRRLAFELAADEKKKQLISAIIWSEPEKVQIIKYIPEIIAPIITGQADVVIPSRSEKAWRSYPSFQQKTEKLINFTYCELTGILADPSFGPEAYSPDASQVFVDCFSKNYGQKLPSPYLQAIAPIEAFARGLRVSAVYIDFEYPPEQKTEEEGPRFLEMVEKRLQQQEDQIRTFFAVAKKLGFIKSQLL